MQTITTDSHPKEAPPALVIGMSIHGLAVARALARRGVVVHCLAEQECPPQPATYTRYGRIHVERGLNTDRLSSILLDLAVRVGHSQRIVLFPTSDRMVKCVAESWPALQDKFALSWSDSLDRVRELQRKDSLAAYCERAGVRHPKSRILASASTCASTIEGLEFPLIIKPALPLSSFKAIRVATVDELFKYCELFHGDLPFVVQEWVEGPEPSLYACTSFLDRGRPAFLFTSRKLAAIPEGLGQGTVFETVDAPEVREIAAKFMASLDISGPVAVEFKRDAAGRFWLIEPNVGRTEYCVDLAIQSGYDLPYIEYLSALGTGSGPEIPARGRECVWFDTDKDLRCFLAHLGRLRGASGRLRRPVFPYLGHRDLRPLAKALLRRLQIRMMNAQRA